MRVAFSTCRSLSNSSSFTQGEPWPLSSIDSEVGQEPRGWELNCAHRGTSQPLDTKVENTVSRIRLKLLKTDVLLTKARHETNVQPNMDIYDCQVEGIFRVPRISVGYDATAWKSFLLMKACVCTCLFSNSQNSRSPTLTGKQKTMRLFLKALSILITQWLD